METELPISLEEAIQETATVDVYSRNARDGGLVERGKLKAGDLHVTYRIFSANAVDDDVAFTQAMAAAEDDPAQQMDLYIQMILENVVAWDLTARPGDTEPIPLTLEALRTTKGLSDVLPDVLTAIGNHKRPNGPNAKRSPGR